MTTNEQTYLQSARNAVYDALDALPSRSTVRKGLAGASIGLLMYAGAEKAAGYAWGTMREPAQARSSLQPSQLEIKLDTSERLTADSIYNK